LRPFLTASDVKARVAAEKDRGFTGVCAGSVREHAGGEERAINGLADPMGAKEIGEIGHDL